jgi:hypothetical protein
LGSRDANRVAAAILEVLAGVRTPTDAAQALVVSVPRYYQLEQRALEGLIAACEPRRLGREQTSKSRVSALEKAGKGGPALATGVCPTAGVGAGGAAVDRPGRAGPEGGGENSRVKKPGSGGRRSVLYG